MSNYPTLVVVNFNCKNIKILDLNQDGCVRFDTDA